MPTPEVKAHPCQCVGYHSPAAYEPNHHHILPQSWGGQTVAENLVWLCPNSHTAVHQLLNHYVRAGSTPEPSILIHYNDLVRDLAAQAWAQRPAKPVYTLAHGGH